MKKKSQRRAAPKASKQKPAHTLDQEQLLRTGAEIAGGIGGFMSSLDFLQVRAESSDSSVFVEKRSKRRPRIRVINAGLPDVEKGS